jgi:hypothetical protein
MALNLLRNSRLFVSTVSTGTGLTKANTWEIPVLGDFSFSQSNEVQDISVEEAGLTPVRGSARFNTAVNPVEWSFTSYLRPYKNYNSTAARSLDRILWHGLVSNGAVNWNASPFASTASEMKVDTTKSNTFKFTDLYFYIKADNVWYKITKAQVNQAEVSFDISTIGQVAWSGMGTNLVTINTPTFATGSTAVREYAMPTMSGEAVSTTANTADWIVQRYTTLNIINRDNCLDTTTTFEVPITGGTLTFNNNVTFLTPEVLGVVNVPIGSFAGSREISGSVSCYLRTGGTWDAGDLIKQLQDAINNTTNGFIVTFNAGGNAAPYVSFEAGNAMLSIPTTDVQDVISANIEFKFLAYTDTPNIDPADIEVGKTYVITTEGDTNWELLGAPTGATVGSWFRATAAAAPGTTGEATLRETDLTKANELEVTYVPSATSATLDANDTD